jgi:hypothetical protein
MTKDDRTPGTSAGTGNQPGNITPGKAESGSGDAAARKQKAATKMDKTKPDQPSWVPGLKDLYNSVLDEPTPDYLLDLIAKLDSKSE